VIPFVKILYKNNFRTNPSLFFLNIILTSILQIKKFNLSFSIPNNYTNNRFMGKNKGNQGKKIVNYPKKNFSK
jgi:hypothetical protein